MVARDTAGEAAVLTLTQGFAIGVVAAIAPAALALLVFAGSYLWFAISIAVSCLGSGAVVGSTIGRGLALKPDPLGVLMVTAIAVVVGDVVAALMLPLGVEYVDPLGMLIGGLVAFGIPAYFFLAFPGLVLGILIARPVMADRGRRSSKLDPSGVA
jgi:hypothetical protein